MDKKLIALAVLLFVAIGLFAVVTVFKIPLSILSQASQTSTPSLEDSLIFAWPLEIKADGKTQSEVTIFIRDTAGKGVGNESIQLSTTVGQIKEGLLSTNKDGKAIFHVSSSEVGVAQIEALVDNKKLPRKISVKFN